MVSFIPSANALLAVLLGAVGIYLVTVLLTRLVGLRSFSKMSSFDFAVTIAMGSVIASTIVLDSVSLLKGAFALALLYGLQFFVGTLRERSDAFAGVLDNRPILLMAGPEILHDNLRRARVTEGDLRAKLREANVLSLDHVHAVVFETTGDITVLHGEPDAALDLDILRDVRDSERLRRE